MHWHAVYADEATVLLLMQGQPTTGLSHLLFMGRLQGLRRLCHLAHRAPETVHRVAQLPPRVLAAAEAPLLCSRSQPLLLCRPRPPLQH